MATWHFAPDAIAKKNLVKDGIEASDILVTGNTIRDSVMQAIPSSFARNKKADSSILVTLHRREKGEYAQKSILNAIAKFACEYPSTTVYYPLRPQPKMKLLAKNTFRSQKNVRLLPPLKHRDFLHLLSEVDLVVTDSGGIQEEAALLGKRTLILRDRSERPDGISEGLVEVIGCKPLHLDLQISCALLNAKNSSSRLINTPSPSGLITRFVIQQTVGWGA
jgi:UDP-N-acetylglucosamine 2-epimerase (non-hydrolysing)